MTDAAGTEYAVFGDDEGRSQLHAGSGLQSLADHIGVSLAVVMAMPVEERSRRIVRRNLELRALHGADALRQLELRFAG